MATYVYVISGDHGRQKIGSSDEPPRRIKELQTGSPYKLRFEFIGEAENDAGGVVEVEAQFILAQHRTVGEWFVVPPDVAITAVMAAAHRLGYRLRPVDPDSVVSKTVEIGTPIWHHWMTVVAAVPLAVAMWWLLTSFDAGQIGSVALIVATAVSIGAFALLRRSLIQAGNTVQWLKGPSFPDQT